MSALGDELTKLEKEKQSNLHRLPAPPKPSHRHKTVKKKNGITLQSDYKIKLFAYFNRILRSLVTFCGVNIILYLLNLPAALSELTNSVNIKTNYQNIFPHAFFA